MSGKEEMETDELHSANIPNSFSNSNLLEVISSNDFSKFMIYFLKSGVPVIQRI